MGEIFFRFNVPKKVDEIYNHGKSQNVAFTSLPHDSKSSRKKSLIYRLTFYPSHCQRCVSNDSLNVFLDMIILPMNVCAK
ncbi:MAG: hypothetical protein CL834_07445 [Crocinitomicaceae bacterium]|nr:hypothetical protein [Crocinitomicaceae bacterium]